MNKRAKVVCPRCGKVWEVQEGESEVDCNCHTYCELGTKPSDCTLTAVAWDHEVGWPYGVHTGSSAVDDSPLYAQAWCSVHNRYSYKAPISIPVDWNRILSRRAPKRLRLLQR